MSCSQVQMTSPSLFPSPDPYRRRRCAKLYNTHLCMDLSIYLFLIYVDIVRLCHTSPIFEIGLAGCRCSISCPSFQKGATKRHAPQTPEAALDLCPKSCLATLWDVESLSVSVAHWDPSSSKVLHRITSIHLKSVPHPSLQPLATLSLSLIFQGWRCSE